MTYRRPIAGLHAQIHGPPSWFARYPTGGIFFDDPDKITRSFAQMLSGDFSKDETVRSDTTIPICRGLSCDGGWYPRECWKITFLAWRAQHLLDSTPPNATKRIRIRYESGEMSQRSNHSIVDEV